MDLEKAWWSVYVSARLLPCSKARLLWCYFTKQGRMSRSVCAHLLIHKKCTDCSRYCDVALSALSDPVSMRGSDLQSCCLSYCKKTNQQFHTSTRSLAKVPALGQIPWLTPCCNPAHAPLGIDYRNNKVHRRHLSPPSKLSSFSKLLVSCRISICL